MHDKSRTWWVRFPGSENAMTFHFADPVTARQVRDRAREWIGGGRLPRGLEIWRG